jgi:hypothetical protein
MPANTPIRATTQESLDIEDITNNILVFKDGAAALVLQVSAVNFNLLSEDEQDAIIYAYAGLLNSLSFPIQILIRSQKKDISNYLNLLKTQEAKQLNPVLQNRITAYREFVEKIVKERNVLDKKFYVSIPFFRTELGLSSSTANSLIPLPKNRAKTKLPYDKSYIIQKALNNLEPKRDHLLRQFARLGLAAKQLGTQELIQLFYLIHNPDAAEGIHTLPGSNYAQPITQSTYLPHQPQPPVIPPSPAATSPSPPPGQPVDSSLPSQPPLPPPPVSNIAPGQAPLPENAPVIPPPATPPPQPAPAAPPPISGEVLVNSSPATPPATPLPTASVPPSVTGEVLVNAPPPEPSHNPSPPPVLTNATPISGAA